VYKNPLEVTTLDENGNPKTKIERDKIVAAWCGRFDDINKTHEKMMLIIMWYNAWTLIENNISLFIQYMISKRKQKYLVPKSQVLFLKDLGANKAVYSDYGWKNTGSLFKSHLISYAIEYLKEEIDEQHDENGETISVNFGVERIPDPMLIKEMSAYHEGLNVDRLVSFAALIAFAKIQQSNRGFKKIRDDGSKKNLENSQNLFKLNNSMFRNIGRKKNKKSGYKIHRNPYKNLR